MTSLLYQLPEPPRLERDSHRGLWFERFFSGYEEGEDEWKIPDSGKLAWISETANQRCGDPEALERQASRTLRLLDHLEGGVRVFEVEWHFATGLGLPHPVENGFAWHPTLGVPFLAASGVKGLLRAWSEVWAEDDVDRASWFGDLEGAGRLLFFDALPTSPVELAADVVTPHMGKWYEQGGTTRNPERESDKVPGDWHDPEPSPFLVVRKAKFLFAVAPRRKTDAPLATEALDALAQALRKLGAGAKTAAGYGRMRWDPYATAMLDPIDREIFELLAEPHGGQPENTTLYKALIEKGRWQGDEAVQVARRLRQRMIDRKEWREETQKKRPERDKYYQRTLAVKALIDGAQ